MSYFNHAFSKGFLCDNWIGSVNADGNKFSNILSGGTAGLTAVGHFGFFAAKDDPNGVAYDAYQCLAGSAAGAVTSKLSALSANEGFYLQGKSFRTSDTIGSNPGHGGYTESWKSKMILPKYINKMYKTTCETAAADVITIKTKAGNANKSCFKCAETGVNNFLRIDVKGSPALRMLNHNAYMVFDTGTSCVACNAGYMNPIYAMLQFALGICDDPIINKFVSVTEIAYVGAAGAATTAGCTNLKDTTNAIYTQANAAAWTAAFEATLKLTGAYVDTTFGTCSFDTRDNNPSVAAFGEPITIEASFLNEDGDQCWCNSADGVNTLANPTPAKKGNGSPYTALKDLILTDGYMQNPYNQGNKDSSRFREIEGSDQLYAAMDMTVLYGSYNIIHTVPRFNNPTGVFDNDQYHYKIHHKCSAATILDDAFTQLETVSGVDFETLGNY